jgi:tetrachloro-p-hydroquinone reductive dehalogenase
MEAPPAATPRLYHAASSYYSAIARLGLVEGGVAFTGVPTDIHRRKAQLDPAYVRLNPHMTVPTLVIGARVLTESRDIVRFAFGDRDEDAATRRWVDDHYAFPVEELTFGWFLAWNPLARRAIPRALGATEAQLRALAEAHPDLRDAYLARAEVFAARCRTFDPEAAVALLDARRRAALALLDALDGSLADGREVLVPPAYGPADVVWTVFLGRMGFLRMGEEITRRPALRRWFASMRARPSFRAADVWDRIKVLGLLKQIL